MSSSSKPSTSQAPLEAPTSEGLLRSARFETSSSSSRSPQSSTPPQPYQAPTISSIISAPQLDSSTLHPLAGLGGQELDYILLEDERLNSHEGTQTLLPTRGWGDELCYGTGTTYLTGLGMGGLWGLREGLFKPLSNVNPKSTPIGSAFTPPPKTPFSAPSSSAAYSTATAPPTSAEAHPTTTAKGTVRRVPFKLRLNTILNSVTRRGSFLGNNMGVLALIYNGINSSLDSYRHRHDIYNSTVAGFVTGLIYKSTAGVKPMLMASTGLAVAAAGWTKFKHYLF